VPVSGAGHNPSGNHIYRFSFDWREGQ
jgi:hypothetical protein